MLFSTLSWRKKTKKPQTFLTSCDLVFNVKVKKLLKIFLNSLPAVISNNVIKKTWIFFMFIFYNVWALHTLQENNAKLFSLTLNKTFSVIIILSLNCHWVVENVSRKTNGKDKAIKILKREDLYDFSWAYGCWNIFSKYIHKWIKTIIKPLILSLYIYIFC